MKCRIYTDTSVLGGCEDEEFAEHSVRLDAEAKELAEAYIAAGVLTSKMRADAQHIAIATVGRVDVLGAGTSSTSSTCSGSTATTPSTCARAIQ